MKAKTNQGSLVPCQAI
uniref:Uncharacterized protein n=1 Tax=Rhizophora mucronata TaxID=61149 RepID=A0A2P2NU79_RHIMU